MKTDIYINSAIGACTEFIPEDSTDKLEEVSVVISPIRVVQDGESVLKVVQGCNLFRACNNPDCYFSKAARDNSGKNVS